LASHLSSRTALGAGGNIATEAVVLAPADGHTLLLTSMGNAVNTSLFERLNYNFLRDIAPVAGISREPLGMEVHPSFPAKTVSVFVTPVRRTAASAAPTNDEGRDARRTMIKVLYIEHDDDNIYMPKMRLERAGDFEVLATEDSESGPLAIPFGHDAPFSLVGCAVAR